MMAVMLPLLRQAYGESGMTVLEELIDAAFRACDVGHAQGQQLVTGAALLTRSGKMYVHGVVGVSRAGFRVHGVESSRITEGHLPPRAPDARHEQICNCPSNILNSVKGPKISSFNFVPLNFSSSGI